MIKDIILIIIAGSVFGVTALAMNQEAKSGQESKKKVVLKQLDKDLFVRYAAFYAFDVENYLDSWHMDIDAQSTDGFTALIVAAIKRNLQVAEALIRRGANPFIIDTSSKRTAKDFAQANNEFLILNSAMPIIAATKSEKKSIAKARAQARKDSKQIVELLDAYEKRWIQDKQKATQSLVLKNIWNHKSLTFAQAWEQASSNADRVYLLERAINSANTKDTLEGIEFYINQSSILQYLKDALEAQAIKKQNELSTKK